MKPEKLTIKRLERASEMKADQWHGKCATLANVACQLVGGHEIYGSWTGPIDIEGYWKASAAHAPLGVFPNHGWLLLEDGRVLDPTRWSFENVKPYIFLDHDEDGFYDEGGNVMRAVFRQPCPTSKGPPIPFELGPADRMAIEHMTEMPIDEVTLHQLVWVASAPYDDLGFVAGSIYKLLLDNDLGGFIPIDNRRRAIREGRIETSA